MWRRVFSRAVGEKTTSIRLSGEMLDLIEQLAEREGETKNSFIVLALDSYLQTKAEAGEIPWPKGFDPKAGTTNSKKR